MDIDEMLNKTKNNTIKNRDMLMDDLKKYSQEEYTSTGQYMMVLDAVQKTLIKKKFLDNIDTWTLEEFLNKVPFHSIID